MIEEQQYNKTFDYETNIYLKKRCTLLKISPLFRHSRNINDSCTFIVPNNLETFSYTFEKTISESLSFLFYKT